MSDSPGESKKFLSQIEMWNTVTVISFLQNGLFYFKGFLPQLFVKNIGWKCNSCFFQLLKIKDFCPSRVNNEYTVFPFPHTTVLLETC